MPHAIRKPSPRVVFIHIQKTAGTSIVAALKHQAHRALPSHGDFTASKTLYRRGERFFLGHFGFERTLEIPAPKFVFTFLRDPVERIISLYHYWREDTKNKHPIFQTAKQLDFEGLLRCDTPLVRSHVDNVQTWTLAGNWMPIWRRARSDLSGEQLLKIARQNLATLDFIGLQEAFRLDAELLFEMLGFDTPVGNVWSNKTADRPRREDLPASTLRLLEPLVELDEELYRHALHLRAERGIPAPAPRGEPPAAVAPCHPSGVKLLAFYLPQYHPIPENDAWWEKGFTEWTKVRPAEPLFPGHDQPRVPGELGYYSLEDESTAERQAALARQHGIHGFCYYHYWFGGRKILEKPLGRMLRSGRPDFPFCVMWANETWTRRWDGRNQDVLLEQTYGEEDARRFALDLVPALRDPRYIRVDGRPLILVYRPADLPDPLRYTRIWRTVWREQGVGEAHLVCGLTTGFQDPRWAGFDAAVEFPPHKSIFPYPRALDPQAAGFYPGFTGRAYRYLEYVLNHVTSQEPYYTLYRTLMVRWDNTARLKSRSTLFLGCTPTSYAYWLARAIERARRTLPAAERFVFINAWNEWAEGTYLEPDAAYGSQFLEATSDALDASGDQQPIFAALQARLQRTKGDAAAYAGACRELQEVLDTLPMGTLRHVRLANNRLLGFRTRLYRKLEHWEHRLYAFLHRRRSAAKISGAEPREP